MSSAAETIKDRLSVVEVIGSYIKLEKSGSNYKACCPFHHEKTPSFFVSPGRSSYYCFGCQAKGDIFTFVQEFEKVDFIGALKLLAERAGVELEQFKNENRNKGEHDRLRGVLELSTAYYERQLAGKKDALDYLKERGLTEKTIKDWRLGFALDEWRGVHDFLSSKKISESDMQAVGLIKQSDESGQRSIYDRFRSRVMFPLFDPSARVIGYSGRIFDQGPESNAPKYLNSPDGPLFNKSDILYGYHKSREGIRQWKYAILVEGQMDLLMCHQNGFTNAVATSGTALTNSHLEKIKRLSDNVMVVYDADRAGLKATLRAWTTALSLGMDVKVAALPQGEDPASLLLKNKEDFKKALKDSKHIIEYYLGILSREYADDSAKFKKAVESEVLPYVAAIDSAIERSNFISKISIQTGITEPDIRTETDKIIKAQEKDAQKESVRLEGRQEYKDGERGEKGFAKEAPGVYSGSASYTAHNGPVAADATARRIAALISWFRSKNDVAKADDLQAKASAILSAEDSKGFEEYVKNAAEEILFEAEVLFSGSSKLEEEAEDLLFGLEEYVLKDKLAKAMVELHVAEHKKDKVRGEELANICQDISTKLSSLHKRRK